jgi:hypothetical protein
MSYNEYDSSLEQIRREHINACSKLTHVLCYSSTLGRSGHINCEGQHIRNPALSNGWRSESFSKRNRRNRFLDKSNELSSSPLAEVPRPATEIRVLFLLIPALLRYSFSYCASSIHKVFTRRLYTFSTFSLYLDRSNSSSHSKYNSV